MTSSVFNFSAGPAMLALPVRNKIIAEFDNWQGLGVSIAEISHRSHEFETLLQQIEANLRDLLIIPKNYRVLFLHGGAQTQFSLVPMNLLGKKNKADYLVYGHWAEKCYLEAKRYGDIKLHTIDVKQLESMTEYANQIRTDAVYFHYCTNETIAGIRLPELPKTNVSLVADMSSDILSKPINVNDYGLIYACAQKNIGIAGLTLVIVRDDWLDQAMDLTPGVFNYHEQAKAGSLYNTINTFACYVAGLTFDWIKTEGGLGAMAQKNARKAKKLYDFIDQSDFYFNSIPASWRSVMNVPFYLPKPELEPLFLAAASQAGLIGLKGHKVAGGIRASLYNAMPEAGVDRLLEVMRAFQTKN